MIGQAQGNIIRQFPGKISANKEAILSFEVPGSLIELPILEGSVVKKGQLLARVDPKRYANKVDEATAKFERAKADFLRASDLVKKDFVSKAEYDAKRAAYVVAESNLSTAKRDLRDTTLYAPFDGIVSQKFVDNHEYVQAKQKICHLQDLTLVDVEINVPQTVMLMIQKDKEYQPVAVFEAAPDRSFHLRFKELSTRADSETQTYRVVYTMHSPKDINILPGMTVTVRVAIPDFKSGGKDFHEIPASAVFDTAQNKPAVWVVDMSTMTVKLREVKVTRLSQDKVRVTAGLKPGDRVVVAGVHFLKSGEKVKLQEEPSS